MEKVSLHTNKKWRRNIRTNYWNGKKQWLNDRQFIRLWVLFKQNKLSAIDSSKQIELENPYLKQQINFIGRLKRHEGVTMFFIIENSGETTFEFSQNTATVVWL